MSKCLVFAAVVSLTTGSVSGCSSKEKDLESVCQAFTRLSQQPELENMLHNERMAFVSQCVSDELSTFSDVASLWEHVAYYEPSASYRMFRRTAEELLGKQWKCPDMERLAPTLTAPAIEVE